MLKLIKTFVFFQRSEKGNYNLLIASVALTVLGPIIHSIIGPYVYSRFVSNLEHEVVSHLLSWQNAVAAGLIGYCLLQVASYVTNIITMSIITVLENRTMENLDNYTAKHIISLSLDFFKDRFTGSIVNKQNTFSGLYEKLFDTIYWDIIPTIIVLIFSLPIIFVYSWVLGMVLVSYTTIYIAVSYLLSKRVRIAQEKYARARTKQSGMISDQIANIQTIKFFGRDMEEVTRYKQWNAKKATLRFASWMKDNTQRTVSNGLRMSADIAILVTCFYLWTKGDITLGGIVLAMSYNSKISERMWQIGNVIKTLRTVQADTAEMMEVLDITPTVKDSEKYIPCDINAGHISISGISFAYPGSDENVFTDFSLDIPAGQKVGIVGESGSGKSTIVQLLMRMMDIQQGEITIDGVPIHLVRQTELRQKMSIVPQETTLFHRTVYENIAYDKHDATPEEVMTAARKAEAHDFISRLSSHGYIGYDVKVGERGIKLSGGQRQRIGLARAFLQHKPLLILDEATSSLDSLSEKKIQRALENLLHEQGTMIIIAHRLSTVHQLDRIIVLDKGRIIEDGTPDELYNIPGGAYRKLVDAQQLITT